MSLLLDGMLCTLHISIRKDGVGHCHFVVSHCSECLLIVGCLSTALTFPEQYSRDMLSTLIYDNDSATAGIICWQKEG